MPILSSRSSLPRSVRLELAHRVAHAQRRGDRAVGRRECRHHRIADGLDHGAGLGGDDLVQHAEMRPHQIEGDEIADPLVKLGRALEVGEQEGEAGDLEALIDVERVGAVDVAESLVGQQALGGEERLAPAEQIVQLVAGDPHARQHPRIGAVLERSRSGPGRSSIVAPSVRAPC